jgi:hypothetical protein
MTQASTSLAQKTVILPAEDRNRMSRLYEEVRIRLEEMAMITSRTLKLNSGWRAEVRFLPLASGAEVEFEAVELVCTPQRCGCYDYRQGSCFELEGAGSEACASPGKETK